MVNICIIHYNTPLLTECLIKSINKFTPDSKIYIFDNSDKYPFTYRQDNIIYFDNTKGQIINFEEWLKKYPNKGEGNDSGAIVNNFGSAKHCYSVEKCIELIDDGFILLDSDVLLKKDISEIVDNNYYAVGDVKCYKVERLLPWICYINVKKCKENDIHYFDERRIYGLSNSDLFYDTGRSFYEDVKSKLKKIKYNMYIEHFLAGSWLEDARIKHKYKSVNPEVWLKKNEKLWVTEKKEEKKKIVTKTINKQVNKQSNKIVNKSFSKPSHTGKRKQITFMNSSW